MAFVRSSDLKMDALIRTACICIERKIGVKVLVPNAILYMKDPAPSSRNENFQNAKRMKVQSLEVARVRVAVVVVTSLESSKS